MDVDTENEELADLHVYATPGEGYGARRGDLEGDVLAGLDGVVD